MLDLSTFQSSLLKSQLDEIKHYISQKQSVGEIISKDSFDAILSEMFKSSRSSFVPVPLVNPFITNAKFTSYGMLEFLNRVVLNVRFITKGMELVSAYLNSIDAHYDVLIEQVRDNFNKLNAAKDYVSITPLFGALPLPLLRSTTTAIGFDNLYVQSRSPRVTVTKMSTTSVFPLQVTSKSYYKLRNYTEGFSITVAPQSDYYKFQFRHDSFDNVESGEYYIQLETNDGKIQYRTSADGSYYGPWRFILDYEGFNPIINDFNENVGVEFRIVPRDVYTAISPNLFLTRYGHLIRVIQSSDYGMVKDLTFSLGRPVTVKSLRVMNFNDIPFIVERAEGSLDNRTYFPVKINRTPVYDSALISARTEVPVKYLRLFIKQETFSEVYESVNHMSDILSQMVLNPTDESIDSFIDEYYYDFAWEYIADSVLKEKVGQLLRHRKLYNEVTMEKVFVYDLAVNNVLINDKELIADLL